MKDSKPKKGLNGHAAAVRRNSPKKPTAAHVASVSVTQRLLNTFARIMVWIAIINILFRCPDTPSQCNKTSPLFCKQYFYARDAVLPVVKPCYNAHAAPYVDLARPYYNAADRAVIVPVQAYAARYVAPCLQQGSALAQRQWDRKAAPQIIKAQLVLAEKYNEKVSPYVDAVNEAAAPYLDIAQTNALQTYHEFLLPAYLFSQPYAIQAYNAVNTFATNTLVPSTIWTFNKLYIFLNDTVLPQVHLLYAEAVEPQLVRIGQRLGRYNGSKPKGGQVPDSFPTGTTAAYSSFTKPTPVSASSTSTSSTATSTASTSPALESTTTASASASISEEETATREPIEEATAARADLLVQPPTAEENESERRRETRIELSKDMILWQEKFMDAAETGANEIGLNVVDICERMESQEVDITGKQAVNRFVDSLDEEIAGVRLEIISIVETESDKAEAAEQVTAAVRRAGISLKERAQKIRSWREKFERDLHTAINQASHAHFDLMDQIMDLALQKMGMKWAWMDGVTYKDWKLYHAMKAEFMGWRDELEKAVVAHKSLAKATSAAADIEDLGMTYAKDAALELKRLKEVGHLKIIAGDASNNFNTDQMRDAAEAAEQQEQETVTEQVAINEPVWEEVAKEQDAGQESQSPIRNEDPVMDGSDDTSNAIWDDNSSTLKEEAGFSTQVEPDDGSMVDIVVDNNNPESEAGSATNSISQEVEVEVGEPVDSLDIEDGTSTIAVAPSEAIESSDVPIESMEVVEPELAVEFIVEEANEAAEEESTINDIKEDLEDDIDNEVIPSAGSSSTPVKAAGFGASAQVVLDREPVLDNDGDGDGDDMGAKIALVASAGYSTASSLASMQYSMAMSIVSAQFGTSTPKPVHKEMLTSVSSAYSNALAQASSRLDEALKAASSHLAATPTAESMVGETTEAGMSIKDEL